MIYVHDTLADQLVKAEIILMDKKSIPLKKDGWNFKWRQLYNLDGAQSYVLRTLNSPNVIEGALCLKWEYDMLIMEALELSPHNIGNTNKRYNHVAGCLIAHGCKESFKLEGPYKGFLTFVSKSNLIQWYSTKYGAILALGQRMYIDWENGVKLIQQYLNRNIKSR